MTHAVSLRGVERRFGATRVLDGIDLDVPAGQRLALLGANGAGKTTLLRILAGLLRATAGQVRVLDGVPGEDRIRARIGLLGHAPFLYPRLTALENLRFWGGIHGVADARDKGGRLLEQVSLDPTDTRGVDAYSQGMRRRVGLACALLHEPELLLLDEPYAGLDREGADALERLLSTDGRTVVVATHEPERAARITTRSVALRDGRLHEEGPP